MKSFNMTHKKFAIMKPCSSKVDDVSHIRIPLNYSHSQCEQKLQNIHALYYRYLKLHVEI